MSADITRITELSRRPDGIPIAIGTRFPLVGAVHTEQTGRFYSGARQDSTIVQTKYALSLPSEADGYPRFVTSTVILLNDPQRNASEKRPPITPLDTDHSYTFDEEDTREETRAQKLARASSTLAYQLNPFGLSVLMDTIALESAGVTVNKPDSDEDRRAVPTEGYEYLERLALIVHTPSGIYISMPDKWYLKYMGQLSYYRFAPFQFVPTEAEQAAEMPVASAGRDGWDDDTVPSQGNPMNFPALGNTPILDGVQAEFMIMHDAGPSLPQGRRRETIVESE